MQEETNRAAPDRYARILTWNIHRAIGTDLRYDLDRIIESIRPHDPDIVALQEVDSRGMDQTNLPLAALKKVLGSHAAEARTINAKLRQHRADHGVVRRGPKSCRKSA